MGFPRELSWALTKYLIRNKVQGTKHFPFVLMLEPSFKCNLACAGCGRIREYRDILDVTMPVDECLAAVDESGAPVICLTGGEPLLHPDIEKIVNGIIDRKRFVYLSTNGLLLEQSFSKFKPSPYMSFVLHLDSLAETYDRFAGRKGVFDTAISGMQSAKKVGFQVRVNTTIYKGTDFNELKQLFTLLSKIPVDGIMVAPAFNYEAVTSDVFLNRNEVRAVFQNIYPLRKQYPFYNTPIYLEFLAGKRELTCMPWSNPTRNPKGWKRPCYLITDGHCPSFKELVDGTDWAKYGTGNDPRCSNCMMHCGFEGSAIDQIGKSGSALWKMISWNLFNGK
jgi:hopanoid biosynthesis associated radical SAM protein HpnH